MSEDMTEWEKNALKACDGLISPEKQIKALVEAARKALRVIKHCDETGSEKDRDALESALEPFKKL